MMDNGLFLHQVNALHDMLGEKDAGKKDKNILNKLFKIIERYMVRQSKRDFPRRSTITDYTTSKQMTAVEHHGNQLCFVVTLHTSHVKPPFRDRSADAFVYFGALCRAGPGRALGRPRWAHHPYLTRCFLIARRALPSHGPPRPTRRLQAQPRAARHRQAQPGAATHRQAPPGVARRRQAPPAVAGRNQAQPGAATHRQTPPWPGAARRRQPSPLCSQAQPGAVSLGVARRSQAPQGATRHCQAQPGIADSYHT